MTSADAPTLTPRSRGALGGLPGMTREVLAERERVVFDWCRSRDLPTAFVLAGGYTGGRVTQDDLVGLHRLTIEGAVG